MVTLRSRLSLTRLAVLALTTAVVSLCFLAGARAEGGVPVPAPAGTEWEIVAGYNTASHSEADGQDPHAIDIVRVPREATAFTSVLSPVDGVVAWRDWDGLSITDAAGFDHLLVHVEPLGHIRRGTVVAVGDPIATVCPAYNCTNGGLAHIHYAVHESRGGGYLGRSIPFAGRYAVEGRDLPWRNEHNLHVGVRFVSSNGPNWSPPARPPAQDSATDDPPTETEQPEPISEPEPESTWTIPADAPVGGWRMIGVHESSSVAGLFANLEAPLSGLVVHNPYMHSYDRFDPAEPTSADIAVRSLRAGQAVWAQVEAGARWLPPPPPASRQVTISLVEGANLISWQGPDRRVAEALRNVAHLSHAYRYDPYTRTWQFWSVAGPAFLDTLTRLRTGDALYVVVRAGSTWTQLP